MTTTPGWWKVVDPPTFASEQEMAEAKMVAAKHIIGYLLNLPYDNESATQVRSWFEPHDFPGVLSAVAHELWTREGYDGDVQNLVMLMIRNGYGGRIRNGVLLTDMYWAASLSTVEQAAFVLRAVRQREALLADLDAESQRAGWSE